MPLYTPSLALAAILSVIAYAAPADEPGSTDTSCKADAVDACFDPDLIGAGTTADATSAQQAPDGVQGGHNPQLSGSVLRSRTWALPPDIRWNAVRSETDIRNIEIAGDQTFALQTRALRLGPDENEASLAE